LPSARARAEAAMARYGERLRGLATTSQIHVGNDIARDIVALRGIELSLEELHRMAADFLARTRDTIETLRGRLGAKYGLDADTSAEALHHYLNQRYRVAIEDGKLEQILERYQRERAQILAFIQERDLFPVPADQDMKILRTPAFMAPSIPAGAMEPPQP